MIGMAVFLIFYHVVNIFTDIKWRVTKNLWHLLFFMGGVMLSIQALRGVSVGEILLFYALGVILWFCIGIFLETVVGMYSPGDTKMMLISALWLSSLAGIERYRESLVVYGLGIATSLLLAGAIAMTRQYGAKNVTRKIKYNLFFWIPVVLTNPMRLLNGLKRLRTRIRQEQENPSMKTQNIPAAIPIAAGTFFALILM